MPFKYNALLGLGLDNTIPLDGAGKIPSTFLPSYVDDVEEYNNLAAFPATGETGKIYVAIDTGFVYRWSGSVYVQIGITAAAGSTTQVQFNDAGAFGGDNGLTFDKTTDALSAGGFIPTSSTVPANGIYLPAANSVAVATNGVQRINIEADGDINIDGGGVFYDATNNRLAIGTTSPESPLHVKGSSTTGNVRIESHDYSSIYGLISCRAQGSGTLNINAVQTIGDLSAEIAFNRSTNGSTFSEAMRIDSGNRLLVGTSTAVGEYTLQIEADNASDPTGGAVLLRRRLSNATISSSGFQLGTIAAGSQTNVGGFIRFESDGGWGSGDYPTRLVFSVTADAAASPTEAMRIKSTGIINFSNAPTHADNTAATAAGLAVGDVYKTVLGVLMIRF